MEWAFRGPATLRDRLGRLDCAAIAAMPPEDLEAVFKEKPALHRYPGSMAKRTHALCVHIVEHYDADAAERSGRACAIPPSCSAASARSRGTARRRRRSSSPSWASASRWRRRGGRPARHRSPTRNPAPSPTSTRAEPRACPRVEAGAEGQGEVEGRVAPGATAWPTSRGGARVRRRSRVRPARWPTPRSGRRPAGALCQADAPAWMTSSVSDQPAWSSTRPPPTTVATTRAVDTSSSMPPWNPGTTVKGIPITVRGARSHRCRAEPPPPGAHRSTGTTSTGAGSAPGRRSTGGTAYPA